MIGDPLLGRVIDDTYRIEAEIGAGGMATVYRATRLRIGDAVAIKVLHSDLLREPQFAERFKREAQAAARLKHPNVITIYDYGVSKDGVIYLVMELIEGPNLRSIIKDTGPMPVGLAAEIVRQVCSSLSEAHRQQVVHRDIKPANIAVETTPDGPRVKVLDFGIASLRGGDVANLTQAGAVLGTPAYMSPEQCLGEELDGRSDIYSLGVVLFEMLCGVVPFNSPAPTAVVMQHVQQVPPPLRVLNASVSPLVEAVVLRALAKPREDRFQTARDFADGLTTAVTRPRLSLGADTLAAPAYSPLRLDATVVQPALRVRVPTARAKSGRAFGVVIGLVIAAAVGAAGIALQRTLVDHPVPKTVVRATTPAPHRPNRPHTAVVQPYAARRPAILPRSTMPYAPTTYAHTASPSETVREYYARLNAQDFPGAYALLSPGFQQQMPFYPWRAGYATTIASIPEVEDSDDPSRVFLRLIARDRKQGEILTTVYSGTWSLISDGRGGWLLDDGRLRVVSRH